MIEAVVKFIGEIIFRLILEAIPAKVWGIIFALIAIVVVAYFIFN